MDGALTLHRDPGQGAGTAHRADGVAQVLARVLRRQPVQHQAAGPGPLGRDDVARVLVQVEPVWGHQTRLCYAQRHAVKGSARVAMRTAVEPGTISGIDLQTKKAGEQAALN